MNPWTPLAVSSVAALGIVLALGCAQPEAPARVPSSVPQSSSASTPAVSAAACHNQPNMAAALDGLRTARGWLDQAEHDKGGWREGAIAATETATRETERGCAFAAGQ